MGTLIYYGSTSIIISIDCTISCGNCMAQGEVRKLRCGIWPGRVDDRLADGAIVEPVGRLLDLGVGVRVRGCLEIKMKKVAFVRAGHYVWSLHLLGSPLLSKPTSV